MHDGLWELTLERENYDFKSPLSCGSIPLWKRTSEDCVEEISGVEHLKAV